MDSLDTRFDKQENAARTGYLIGGFITGTLTIEEREELDAWVLQSEDNMQLFEDMTDDQVVDRFMEWLATRDTEAKLAETKQRLKFKRKPRVLTWWHYAAAACAIGIVGLVIYSKVEKVEPGLEKIITKQNDILPGTLVAELHLPGGKIVGLNASRDTVIGNIIIKEGQVEYKEGGVDTAMHEIIIPRKGFYKLVLPDGSRVWLNSESSIRYPGSFVSGTRNVAVTGETFFEVAKDKTKPFMVSAGDVNVQAVGTQFNINGFDKLVTLTEGSVLVSDRAREHLLKPGEQIDVGRWKVKPVDTGPVLAWTQNKFHFRNSLITEIMPQLERWYDAKVLYESVPVSYHFNGTIDRNVPLSRVLQLLEGTGQVHFSIDGNIITVKK